MKRKVQFSLVIHMNGTDSSGTTYSHPAAVMFDAEVEILPMEPGIVLTGITPNAFDEIDWHDVATGEGCRKILR